MTIETLTAGKEADRTAYFGLLMKMKDLLFLDLVPNPPSCGHPAQGYWLPTHWFLKVEIKGQTLELGRIKETWLRTLLEKQPRTLGHVFGRPGVLTDSPEAMQQFLQRHGHNPEAFILTTFHRREGTP